MSAQITSSACPLCSSSDTEEVESETTLSGAIRKTYACNQCYAGWEDTFTRQDREITHEPEADAE